ncbi:MAG: AGE family epimerase/isomerase [Candidatus Glassbacteria bacterium]
MKIDLVPLLDEVRQHLHHELIPYWRGHGDDPECGGFLTCFDRHGRPTGDTNKNLLAHCRLIYSFSSLHRSGMDPDGSFLARARSGAEWVLEHFADRELGGWFWIVERDGTPVDRKKIIYGYCFVIYGFSELALASGDQRWLEVAEGAFDLLESKAADTEHGGWWEFFEEDWRRCRPGAYGGDRKSFDVHMHLMEALTNLYAASGRPRHREKALEVIELITGHMLHPGSGTGIAQFSGDFTPQRAIIFKNVWGSDREAEDLAGRPLDNTSYGHNVEFGWLLGLSAEVLGLETGRFDPTIKKLYEHCLEFGIDRERGGVYCEGPRRGPARERNKEFWQQAETLIAMLDGCRRFGEDKYAEAYRIVHRFVFDRMINHEVGEWLPLLDQDNRVIWDYMGHQWKINYHTVRSMIECERRLASLTGR